MSQSLSPAPVSPFNPPRCRVYNAGNQAITTGTLTAITFGSERYDSDTMHSTSSNTNRITATTAGVYHFGGNVNWEIAGAAGDRHVVWIRINGTIYIAVQDQTNGANLIAQVNIGADWNMAAGDYAELLVYHNRGSNLNIMYDTAMSPEFWAHWVGPTP